MDDYHISNGMTEIAASTIVLLTIFVHTLLPLSYWLLPVQLIHLLC